MNKYVLILPLVILSVFLGYFCSSLQIKHVYAIAAVTTVLVATSGYLLFLKHQKVGDSKRTRKTKGATAFIVAFLFSALIGVQLVRLTAANPLPAPPTRSMQIKSDGTVEPSTVPIQQEGNVYTFMSDISNFTISVNLDNIVIDGGGFRLIGVGAYTGIDLASRSNVTIKNVIINNFGCGINLGNSLNNVVTGNKITASSAVSLSSSNSNQIYGNRISGNYGIKGLGDFNNITGNDFRGAKYSVRISGNNNTVSGNYFENDESVMIGVGSHYNVVSNNTMRGGRYGVFIYGGSSHNVVFGNNITIKNENAIKIQDSFNNIVTKNSLVNNEIGIYVANPAFPDSRFAYSTNNTFYHNNFVGNTKNVHVEKGIVGGPRPNLWDNGTTGNYWSNYTGTDLNGDNIGDTHYVIDNNNTDHYPLMKPFEIPEPEIPDVIPEFQSWTPTLLVLSVFTVTVAIYKRRLRNLRNKKRMSCKHELLEKK